MAAIAGVGADRPVRPAPAMPAGASLALLTEPRDGVGPLLSLIGAARRRIEMTMYELDDRAVEDALVRAHRRGVRVEVLLDGSGYWPPRENAAAVARLRMDGVAVRYASKRYPLTHEKSIVADGRLAAIASFNLTPRYYASDRDFAVIDRRRRDAERVEAAFVSDWGVAGSGRLGGGAGGEGRPGGRGAGGEGRLGGGGAGGERPGGGSSVASRGGALVFSPDAQRRLLALLASARRTLDVESEELSDRAAASVLCAAARKDVRVRLTMTYSPKLARPLQALASCGAEVRVYPADSSLYIHAKAFVVDDRVAFVGSQNLSDQSLCCNRELGIVFSARPLVRSLSATLQSDFAGAQSIARR